MTNTVNKKVTTKKRDKSFVPKVSPLRGTGEGSASVMLKHTQAFLQHLGSSGYSPRTVEDYECSMRTFFRFLQREGIDEPSEINPDHLRAYQDYLFHEYRSKKGKPVSLAYQSNLLKILKPFFRFLLKSGVLLTDPAVDLQLPRLPRRLPRNIMTQREIRKLLKLPDLKTPSGIRDRLILELLYSTGARRGEMLNLALQDINLSAREIIIRNGKGGKDRMVPIAKKTAAFVERYLAEARPTLLGKTVSDRLILSDAHSPPAKCYLAYVVRKYAKKAKLKKHITTHSFRHTCATHLLKNKANIRVIQELLGHESLNTTQKYTRVEITDLKRVIDKHHPREAMEE